MIRVKIDVTKIKKEHLFKGEKGIYLDITLMENKDGPSQYGDDGFAVQDIGKDARESGEKGPILGNWRHVGKKPAAPSKPAAPAQPSIPSGDDDIPF
jgi:hypothetical protein